jgi:hypothetical protein
MALVAKMASVVDNRFIKLPLLLQKVAESRLYILNSVENHTFCFFLFFFYSIKKSLKRPKGVIRSRQSKKNKQYSVQRKTCHWAIRLHPPSAMKESEHEKHRHPS